MKKRFIAVVLASLALWSVPVAFASPGQPGSPTADKPARQAASGTHDHSCCPGIHSRLVPQFFVMPAPATMPCGDQHPCCAKQGPQNPPSLPAASRIARPGSEGVPVTIADHNRDGRTRIAAEPTGSNPFPSYSVRSTVLRI